MEGIELGKAIEEVQGLIGARLSKVHQVGDLVLLRLYRPAGALALDLGGKAFHRTALRVPVPPTPPPFAQLLRTLTGQRLLALEQAGWDRVVRLCFPQADLVLDLRPRVGDLFFLGPDGRTVSFRGGELQPVEFTGEGDPVDGLGPELRRAAMALGHSPSREALGAWARDLVAHAPAGYVYAKPRGLLASFFLRPDLGEAVASFPTFWQALDRVLEGRLFSTWAKERRERVKRAIRRRNQALKALAQTEAEAAAWPEIKAKADLILTRLSQIPTGVAELEVEGFDGQPVRLTLDPAVPPLAYAQLLYRKAGKLRRRLDHSPSRRRELERELSQLRELAGLLECPELAPYLEEELAALGEGGRKPQKPEPPVQPRETVIDGFPVIVGRSARENERLLRGASSEDLWLHAREVPGAHVLIRTGGRPVPEAVLRRAAQLAAWHSRARGEAHVAVSYTEARYVRKPRGAAPGSVTLLRENVVVVSGKGGP